MPPLAAETLLDSKYYYKFIMVKLIIISQITNHDVYTRGIIEKSGTATAEL